MALNFNEIAPLNFPNKQLLAPPFVGKEERLLLKHIRTQLEGRPEIPAALWRLDSFGHQIRSAIGDLCADVSGWPKGRFIPNDPYALVAVEDMVDCDLGSLLESEFRIRTLGEDWKRFCDGMEFLAVVKELVCFPREHSK